ncbi:HAD hydrolase-like protein [Gordonia oryzae]|uniref:HAD hydrolase-like protein n=1 Tax=Gordonia oryzae TaxID=2487349 RepID=UPI0026A6F991
MSQTLSETTGLRGAAASRVTILNWEVPPLADPGTAPVWRSTRGSSTHPAREHAGGAHRSVEMVDRQDGVPRATVLWCSSGVGCSTKRSGGTGAPHGRTQHRSVATMSWNYLRDMDGVRIGEKYAIPDALIAGVARSACAPVCGRASTPMSTIHPGHAESVDARAALPRMGAHWKNTLMIGDRMDPDPISGLEAGPQATLSATTTARFDDSKQAVVVAIGLSAREPSPSGARILHY